MSEYLLQRPMVHLDIFETNFGRSTNPSLCMEWLFYARRPSEEAPCHHSCEQDEARTGQKGRSKGKHNAQWTGQWVPLSDLNIAADDQVARCGIITWNICVVHVHHDVQWGNVCRELRMMCLQSMAQQAVFDRW